MRKLYKNIGLVALGLFGITGTSQAQISFADDFESGLGNWNGTYATSTSSSCNGTSARDNIFTSSGGNLTAASSLGTSNGGTVTLDFNYQILNYSGLGATTVDHGTTDVQIATSSSGPWTTVYTIDAGTHIPAASCAPVNVTFTAPVGDFYLRYNTTYNTGDYYFYIDDIVISQGPAPTCFQPTSLTASNITASSADLGWTAGASETVWNVEWGTPGFTPGTGAEDGNASYTSSNPTNASGLASSTDYEFYVQGVCGSLSPLVISGVYDAPLTGGTPKGVELYVMEDIADLSEFGIGSAANGGASSGADFVFPAVAVTAGTYIYVASESTQFTSYFGFAPDYTDGSMNINGDDVVELFHNTTVVDVFGELGVDGTGQAWEYLDGWAYRVSGTGADGSTFNVANWTYSGANALDPCASLTNGTCSSVIPVGTYTNSSDNSTWAGPFAFTTQCNPISTFPYVEDFETGGAGWTFGGASSSWAIGTPSNTNISAAANGTGAAVTNLTGSYNANEVSYLYTPCFNFSGFNYPVIEFNHIRDFENCCDEGWVEYTTDGTVWTKLGSSTSWISNGYNDSGNQWWDSDNTTWTLTAHELTALVGQAYVQFRFVMSADFSGQQEGQGVDDFTIYDIACPDPTNLVATWVDNDSVIVDWDAGYLETDWTVELGAAGFTPGTGAEIYSGSVSTDPTDTIGGLDQITDYDVYVMADCGGGDMSAWVGPVSFTTLPNCAAPSNFIATVISPDSVSLQWTAGSTGETEWTIEYGMNGFTQGTGDYVTVTGMPNDTIDMLMQNTTYDFYLLGNCSATDSSLWVGPETVTTPLFCNNVSGLSATTVTDTAFLSWSAGIDGETEWNVEYGPAGFTLGTGTMYTTTNNSPDTLLGLNPSAVYEFYVQASCASGDTSLFTGPYSFAMPLGNDTACSAINLSVDGTTNYFSNNGATASSDETSNLSIPGGTGVSGSCSSPDGWCSFELSISRTIWFEFTAPASGNVNVDCGINSSYDGQVAIFDITDCGDMSTATLIAANDDNPAGGLAPNVTVCGLTPGNTYYIMHDEYSGEGAGTVSMTLTEVSLDAGTDGMMNVCSTESIDLNTVATTNPGGNWMFDANPSAIINDSIFVANTVPAGNQTAYYVLQVGCATDTVEAVLNIVEEGNSGTAVSPFTACNADVFLPDGLEGVVEAGGTWSDDSGTGLLAGPNNNVFVAHGAPAGTYPFTYTVDNGVCPAASTTVQVTIANCTDINENNMALTVYPNPNNGSFFIQSDMSGESTVTITDVTGKTVYNNVVGLSAATPFEVSLDNVETGMYLINISNANGSQVMNMIIK